MQVNTWRRAGGWTGWQSLGGKVSGTPVPVNDPVTGNIEVYTAGADNGPSHAGGFTSPDVPA